MKKGSLFITDSEFSKTELLDFFPVDSERVVSIPLGADPIFQPRSREAIEPVLARYGLVTKGYALSVGTIEPRKNVERLIDAYASLPKALRRQFPLVLAGGYGWNSTSIHEKIARYSQEGWLKYLTYVPDHDLACIYSGAKLFACVSHYEGFGLPVLEAMSSGVPVICSNAASLPEVGGNAVLYVKPNDQEQISKALLDVLSDDLKCEQLAAQGLARAQQFSWDKVVEQTIEAYGRIV
jgi:alpha-1,3-rhamnosyl/mannosyltransferase